ncbi:MAG: HAMP domain-containing sensor histidine kinase [Tateyamaria sp.]
MISEFYEHLEENLKDAMTDEAKEIVSQTVPNAPGFGLDINALRFQGVEGTYRYTVYDETGLIIAGGEGSDVIWRQLSRIDLGEPQPILLPGDRLGVGLKAQIANQEVYVLVSTFPKGNNETQFNKLLHELEEGVWWVILGVAMVLIAAILATRRALSPLTALSDQAHQIGPGAANQRLTNDRAPTEIEPLIADINKAFDRLEQGYKAQRDFASNVAHEIRTPLAVLRSSVDRIEDPVLKQSLTQDTKQLDRIFGQLIDLSRADAALQSTFETVDLHTVAVDVATELAPVALRSGLSLSVTGPKEVLVQGSSGLLLIALRNLVRNAVQYSPKNSEVGIELLSDPAGWRVSDQGPGVPDDLKTTLFERFNRGTQANTQTKGAGIGLAIVESVAQSHGAHVVIQDRDEGGSVFSFIFKEEF